MASFSAYQSSQTTSGGTVTWTVSGLSSAFNTSNYTRIVISTTYLSSSGTSVNGTTSPPANIVSSAYPSSGSTSTSASGSFSYSAGTWVFYAFAQDRANSKYWSIGQATVIITAATPTPTYPTPSNPSGSCSDISYTSARISWYLSPCTSARILVRPASSSTAVYDSWHSSGNASTVVSGLSPGTTYVYNIGYQSGVTSSGGKVTTWIYSSSPSFTTLSMYNYYIYWYDLKYSAANPWQLSSATNQTSTTYTFTAPIPTRSGYIFGGWCGSYSGDSGTGSPVVGGGETITLPYYNSRSITLYAKWTARYCTVYFDGNGATNGSVGSQTTTQGSTITLPANGYSRTYTATLDYNYSGASTSALSAVYQFNGWSYNGTVYSPGTSFTTPYTTSVTMYATWSGGAVTLPTPTRTGYQFDGWYTAPSGGTQVISPVILSSDQTFYAHWTEIPIYTIYFNGNGSTGGSMPSQQVRAGNGFILPANEFVKQYTVTCDYNYGGVQTTKTVAWEFACWSCNNKTYADSSIIPASDITENMILYAQWTGGYLTASSPTRQGYTFTGWYDAAVGGNLVVAGGGTVRINANTTLYAHWTAAVVKPSISYSSHTDTTITVLIDRKTATTGVWIVEASTSSAFDTIAASSTVSDTTTTNVTLSGLSPDTTYYLRATHSLDGNTAVSDVITASTRISQFKWTSNDAQNVVAGAVFEDVIAATKWNDLIDRIAWCRQKKGLSVVSLSDVASGEELTAAKFNAVRGAIATMNGNVTSEKSKGEEIRAIYFANDTGSLKTSINTIIVSL